MKVKAKKEKAGAYEFLQKEDKVDGGIYINDKNRGIGFIGDPEKNYYSFEFQDGVFSKEVKIFFADKSHIGTVKLGFSDNGTLETLGGKYEWQVVGSSKRWTDAEKNTVMFLDLENNSETSPSVLFSGMLDAKAKELLMLCGWYLLVIEWRAGLTNATLAGMPVKSSEFKKEGNQNGSDWFDVLLDITTDF